MIRQAHRTESEILTALSFASKRYWKYPEKYLQIWEQELTITPEYIDTNSVFAYILNQNLVAYYSIIFLKDDMKIAAATISKGYWLEHMFIAPEQIGTGIGSTLFTHLRKWCKQHSIKKLSALVDPNAAGFYSKMGCVYQKEIPSTIPERTTPLYTLAF